MYIKKLLKSKAFKVFAVLGALLSAFFVESAFATGTGTASGIALSSITHNVNTTVSQMARILTDVALIAGIGFILASFFKFHQHKLNPTQVPISQGVTLLVIGACLTLFVVMLPTAKKAVFGDAPISHVGASSLSGVIGGSTN